MSERMTDNRIDFLESHNDDDGVEAAQVADLIAEARRARRVEQEQAETIKALADALERRCVEHRKGCDCGGCKALRLAGRLP